MTKVQAFESFVSLFGDCFDFRRALANDRIAIEESWNNYTDMLCKDGEITARQYDTWIHPF